MLETSKEKSHEQDEDAKLEDILKSIRGVIDNQHNSNASELESDSSETELEQDEMVLELTSVVSNKDNKESLISNETARKTKLELNKFTDSINKSDYSKEESSLNSKVDELMYPLIREWLNNNLPRIVEKVVSEEIQKIIPKQ